MDLTRGEWISLLLHGSRRGGGEGHWIHGRWTLPVGEDVGVVGGAPPWWGKGPVGVGEEDVGVGECAAAG